MVPPAVHNTFTIERTFPVSPERVFRAFADPAKKRRWFVESSGHKPETYEMDFRVGGTEHVQFRLKEGTPLAGVACTNHTTFLDLVENRRVVAASSMVLGGKRISASLTTFELTPLDKGTSLLFTHQGVFFEGADGPEMRSEGWRKLLDELGAELNRHAS
jgi:uncharacterized protein YndB with AHSA1/START domain